MASDGIFTMNGGNIVGNFVTASGGGVYDGGTFTMNGGNINGNIAQNFGGGVYVVENCSFIMTDGTLRSNSAQYGGAILGMGNINLTAGKGKTINITKNKAVEFDDYPAEAGVASWAALTLSGKVIIKDNVCDSKYNTNVNYPVNLSIYGEPITISGALTGSDIYISYVDDNDYHIAGLLTSGYRTQNPGAKLNGFFHYEGPSSLYMELNDNGELEVKVVKDTEPETETRKSTSSVVIEIDNNTEEQKEENPNTGASVMAIASAAVLAGAALVISKKHYK